MLPVGLGCFWVTTHTPKSHARWHSLTFSPQPGQASFPGSDLTAGAGSQVQRPVLFFLPDFAISEDHSAQATRAGRVLLFCVVQRSSASLLEFSCPMVRNKAYKQPRAALELGEAFPQNKTLSALEKFSVTERTHPI